MTNKTLITYATGTCWLGSILVAHTPRGMCAVLLGDSAHDVVADLRARFPRASIQEAPDAALTPLQQVIDVVERLDSQISIPLDLSGTPFQQRVWAELRTIPAGQTSSYSRIAERIGAASSVRAVAGAVAANPVAVVIPCHRVVRSDGTLSGYRWGTERKRLLLAREGVTA